MVHTLDENSQFLVYSFIEFFWKHYFYDYDWNTMGTALLVLVNSCTLHQNNGTILPSYIRKEDALLPAVFDRLYSITNQQLFKKNYCNQSSHNENYRQFLLQMEAIVCLPQSRHFMMNRSQRRALVSPWRMHCMHSAMTKSTSWAEVTSYSKTSGP